MDQSRSAILNKEMTPDEIAAAIESEGEVNVGNWTYTANDTLIAKFQEYVNDTYGVEYHLELRGKPGAKHLHDQPLHCSCRAAIHPCTDVHGDRGELLGRGAVAAGAGHGGIPAFRADTEC